MNYALHLGWFLNLNCRIYVKAWVTYSYHMLWLVPTLSAQETKQSKTRCLLHIHIYIWLYHLVDFIVNQQAIYQQFRKEPDSCVSFKSLKKNSHFHPTKSFLHHFRGPEDSLPGLDMPRSLLSFRLKIIYCRKKISRLSNIKTEKKIDQTVLF